MRTRTVLAALLLPAMIAVAACAQSRIKEKEEMKGRGERAWLGVALQDVTPGLAKEMHLKTTSGALVKSVVDESPAEKAGLKENDIIVEFGGTKIEDSEDLVSAVHSSKPDATEDIVVLRKDERTSLKATLGKRSEDERYSLTSPAAPIPPMMERFQMLAEHGTYGLLLITLPRQLGEYFGAPNNHGVLVEEVRKKSPGEKAGLKAGDVIVKIGPETIEEVRDVHAALDDYKKGEKASIEVLRKGERKTLSLEIDPGLPGSMPGMMRFHEFHHDRDGESWNDESRLEGGNDWMFDSHSFKRNMEELRKNLREMGKTLREDFSGMNTRLRRELQNVAGV